MQPHENIPVSWSPPELHQIEDQKLSQLVSLIVHKYAFRSGIERLRLDWGVPASGYSTSEVGPEVVEPPEWNAINEHADRDERFFNLSGFREFYKQHRGNLGPFFGDVRVLVDSLNLQRRWDDFVAAVILFNSTEYLPDGGMIGNELNRSYAEYDGALDFSADGNTVTIKIHSKLTASEIDRRVRAYAMPHVALLPDPGSGRLADIKLQSRVADLARNVRRANPDISREDLVAQVDTLLYDSGVDLEADAIIQTLRRATQKGL